MAFAARVAAVLSLGVLGLAPAVAAEPVALTPPPVLAQEVLVLLRGRAPPEGVVVEARAPSAPKREGAPDLWRDAQRPPAAEASPLAVARADREGRCRLEGLAPGAPCEFVARGVRGLAGSRLVRLVVPPNLGRVLLPLSLGDPLSIEVADEGGRPVAAEATVTQARDAWPSGPVREDAVIGAWEEPWRATDPRGRLSWDAVPAGGVDLRVRVPGRAAVRRRLLAPAARTVPVSLAPDAGPGTVLVRVARVGGEPVPGARVAIEATGPGLVPTQWLRVVETDARGHASLDGVGGSRVRVRHVAKEGFVSADRDPSPADAGHGDAWPQGEVPAGGRAVLEVRLARAGRVEGVVRDEAGAPVGGASVTLATPVPWVSWTTVAGPDGAYAFAGLPPLVGQVGAAGEGWVCVPPAGMLPLHDRQPPGVPVAVRPDEGAVARCEVRVRRAASSGALVLEGIVVGDDGAPVPGAWVEAVHKDRPSPTPPPLYARADARGRYRVADGLRPGRWEVRAISDDGESWWGDAILGVSAAYAPEPLEIRRRLPVAGRVLGADGQPRGGVAVTPLREPRTLYRGYQGPEPAGAPTVADAEGRFAFGGAPMPVAFRLSDGEMEWQPLVAREDLQDWPTPLKAYAWFLPPTDAADVRCLPSGDLSGTVRDAQGRPLPAAVVRLDLADASGRLRGVRRSRTVWTDEAGRFRALPLVLGTYAVHVEGVRAEGLWSTGPLEASVVALPAPRTPPRAPAAPRQASCVGRVVDEAGRGVPGVLVTPARGGPWPWPSSFLGEPIDVTDAQGAFRLEGVPPELGEVRAYPGEGWCPSAPVARGADGASVVLPLVRGVPLEGRVRAEDGAAVPGALVTVLVPGHEAHRQRLVTGEDGTFRTCVPPGWGPFVVQACSGEGSASTSPAGHVRGVAAGATDVVVVLRGAHSFLPRVVAPWGASAVGATVVLSAVDRDGPPPLDSSETVSWGSGEVKFWWVRAGRYTVVAVPSDPALGPSDPVEAEVPSDRPPLLALKPAGPVRWAIAGAPPAGHRAVWRAAVGAAGEVERALAVGEDGALAGSLPDGLRGTLWVGGGRDDRFVLAHGVGRDAPPRSLAWADGAAITGRVTDLEPEESGFVVVAVGRYLRVEVPMAADRTFSFRGLPPGEYRLRARQAPVTEGDPSRGAFRMQVEEPPLKDWLAVSTGTSDIALPAGLRVVVGGR